MNEIVEKRSTTGKVFVLDDGSQKIVSKMAPVHYTDEKGIFQDIDTAAMAFDKSGNLVADKLPFIFTLHQKGVGFDYQSRSGGFVSVELDQVDGIDFDKSLAYSVKVVGNVITYSDLKKDLDISFKINADGIQSLRTIKSELSPKSFQWKVEHDAAGDVAIKKDQINGKDSSKKDAQVTAMSTPSVVASEGRFSYFSQENWTGKVVEIDPVTRVKTLSDNKTFPVVIDPDIVDPISANNDDGTEFASTTIWHQNYIELATAYGPTAGGKFGYGGLRFNSLAITQGATIALANLKIYCTGNIVSYGGGTIFGYASDNANAFASGAGNGPKDRARTSASTLLPAPTSTGFTSYDVTTSVQEIVNRAGWASGNSMAFFLVPTGGLGFYISTFYDISAGSGNVAVLEITLPAAPVAGPTIITGIINNPIQ